MSEDASEASEGLFQQQPPPPNPRVRREPEAASEVLVPFFS